MVDTGEVLVEKNVRPRGRIRDAFGALIGRDDQENKLEDVDAEVAELTKNSQASITALEAELGNSKPSSRLGGKLGVGSGKGKAVDAQVEKQNKDLTVEKQDKDLPDEDKEK